MTFGARCIFLAPMLWRHPKDASKHATELGLIAHATFACDLIEESRVILEHELFGSKHPKSREVIYGR